MTNTIDVDFYPVVIKLSIIASFERNLMFIFALFYYMYHFTHNSQKQLFLDDDRGKLCCATCLPTMEFFVINLYNKGIESVSPKTCNGNVIAQLQKSISHEKA